MNSTRQPTCLLLAALVAGCTVGPNFKPPHEPVAEHYAWVQSHPNTDRAPVNESDLGLSWWHGFHDAELDHLEERVVAGNLDLRAAFLRILESRAQVQSARAQGLPSLNASVGYTREQLGVAGILKSQHIAPTAADQGLIGSVEKPVNLYQLGFDASWELDLFGKVRRAVEAADARALQAVEAHNDLRISLQAEIAQTYFQLRANQQLQKIVGEQVDAQRNVLELTRDRGRHGLAAEVDVQSAQAQLSSLQSQLAPYDQAVATSRHALAVLTGEQPQALDAEVGSGGDLPDFPQIVPVGVPSTLARRRPDIRESEAALHVATAQVGVSVASLFPDISLTGTAGLRNLSPGYLFDWDSHFYTAGSTVSVPIFRGGALVANVRLARAQAAEAAINYRSQVLGALQEVEDGLSGLQADAARLKALKESFDANQRALEVEVNAYQHGLVTYISVLTLQLQTVQAQQQKTQAALTQVTDLIKLYKALGGGWEETAMNPGPEAGASASLAGN